MELGVHYGDMGSFGGQTSFHTMLCTRTNMNVHSPSESMDSKGTGPIM